MDTLFIDSLGFFFLSNLNNDCFSVCGGATVREAAVATSEASLLSSFCGTHASSMSLMCFFFCFVFFSVLRLTSSRRPCDSSLYSSGAIRGGFEAFWKIEAHLLYLFFFCFVFSFLKWNKVEKCRLSIWRHNLTVLIQECAVHIHLIKVNFFVTMRLLLLGIRNCTHCRLFFWQVFFSFPQILIVKYFSFIWLNHRPIPARLNWVYGKKNDNFIYIAIFKNKLQSALKGIKQEKIQMHVAVPLLDLVSSLRKTNVLIIDLT